MFDIDYPLSHRVRHSWLRMHGTRVKVRYKTTHDFIDNVVSHILDTGYRLLASWYFRFISSFSFRHLSWLSRVSRFHASAIACAGDTIDLWGASFPGLGGGLEVICPLSGACIERSFKRFSWNWRTGHGDISYVMEGLIIDCKFILTPFSANGQVEMFEPRLAHE